MKFTPMQETFRGDAGATRLIASGAHLRTGGIRPWIATGGMDRHQVSVSPRPAMGSRHPVHRHVVRGAADTFV